MKVSIIIPTFERLHHVQNLWSNLQTHLPHTLHCEVIFIVNGPDQKTKAYLQQATTAIVLQCDRKTAAYARNLGVARATGDWLLFLDDDVHIPKHYFPTAITALHNLQPDVLGGPEIPPLNSNSFQRAYAFCQAHPLVTGHTYRRHHCRGENPYLSSEHHLILCHLWVRREVFKQGFNFPSQYPRNEENILLCQLQKKNAKIYHHPKLTVYHTKKKNFSSVIRATWTSGKFRMISFVDYPESFHPLFLAPALLIISPPLWTAIPYSSLCFFVTLQCLLQKRRLPVFFWTLWLIPTIHLSYGAGLLAGLLNQLQYLPRLVRIVR